MKAYCIKEYKTEIDILDLPKIDHIVFKKGHFYEVDLSETPITDDLSDDYHDVYSIIGEDEVYVTFNSDKLNDHFAYGVLNIRNAKLNEIGI